MILILFIYTIISVFVFIYICDKKCWEDLILILVGLIGIICCNFIDETKQESEIKSIFYYRDETSYIDSYTIKGNEIFATGVEGKEVILPRDHAVIKNKGNNIIGDREYRPWIIEQIFSGEHHWTLFCRDETGKSRHIQVSRSLHNRLVLEKMLNKSVFEWTGMHSGYTILNMDVEAIIYVWIDPEEIRGQTEFRGFRINEKYYLFETS